MVARMQRSAALLLRQRLQTAALAVHGYASRPTRRCSPRLCATHEQHYGVLLLLSSSMRILRALQSLLPQRRPSAFSAVTRTYWAALVVVRAELVSRWSLVVALQSIADAEFG